MSILVVALPAAISYVFIDVGSRVTSFFLYLLLLSQQVGSYESENFMKFQSQTATKKKCSWTSENVLIFGGRKWYDFYLSTAFSRLFRLCVNWIFCLFWVFPHESLTALSQKSFLANLWQFSCIPLSMC